MIICCNNALIIILLIPFQLQNQIHPAHRVLIQYQRLLLNGTRRPQEPQNYYGNFPTTHPNLRKFEVFHLCLQLPI